MRFEGPLDMRMDQASGELTAATIVAGIFTALAVSIASVGLPGTISFIASVGPICLVMGVPLDILPLLLAVEVLPDIFRTLGNVMGDMSVTAIVNRHAGEEPPAPEPAD